MLSFSHTLISLPFGLYLKNPLLIFLAAFLFHFFCDSLLHWNIFPFRFKSYPYHLVFLDVTSGLLAAWLLLPDQFLTLPVLAAIWGGNLPDILHGLWDLLGIIKRRHYLNFLRPFFIFHHRLQHETTSVPHGLISQIILIAIALTLIIRQ